MFKTIKGGNKVTKSIYLSPSTQENNIGYGKYGTEEKRMNQIADVLEKILENHNIKVYRNKPEMTLKKLVEDSNFKRPDLHFAIHSNAGGGRGTEIYAFSSGGKGEKAARIIYQEIKPITPTKDRGVKFNSKFYELKYTKSPAVLIEIAFHDNKEDSYWIINNINKIAIALAKGILKYFDVDDVEYRQATEEPAKVYYRVMAGSFSKRKNAENQIKNLNKAGFDATIMIYKR